MLDLAGGKLVGTPFAGAVYGAGYRDGVWFAGEMGEDNAYLVYEGGELRRFALGKTGGIAMLLDGAPHILVIRYGENGAAEYELYGADGSFLSRCSQPDNTVISYEPVWSERDNGYFLIFTDWEKGDGLYFWDLSVQQTGEALAMHPKEEEKLVGEAVDAALYERAVQIGKRYGFTVKIAELTDTRFSDHTAEQVLDEATISAALDILEEALSAYPAGYTGQLTYGTQYEVEVQLIGATWRDGAGDTGFTDFSAFTDIQAGRTVVALDINRLSGLEQTIHHELAHVADDRLQFAAQLRPDALYSADAWNALNPSGFAYTDDYYTMPAGGYEDWFINLYAQTFAKEDFARTMEYAMMGRWDVFEGYEGRTAKLEYLCRCLRDGFDTAGWPEQTVWEQTLYEARQ